MNLPKNSCIIAIENFTNKWSGSTVRMFASAKASETFSEKGRSLVG